MAVRLLKGQKINGVDYPQFDVIVGLGADAEARLAQGGAAAPVNITLLSDTAAAAVNALVSTPWISTCIPFGTSIEANNNTNNGLTPPSFTINQTSLANTGIVTWANILLGNALQIIRNAGIPGDTTAGMLARVQTDVIAYKPAWCIVGGPINDITTGVAAATIVANLKAIYSALTAAGIRVVACTILPNNSINSGGSASQKEALAYVNAWIRAYGVAGGAVVADTFSALYDPATACGATAGMLSDNTHPGTLGAFTAAGVLKAALSTYLRAQPVIATGGIDAASTTNPYGNLLPSQPSVAGVDGSTSLHSGTTTSKTGAAPIAWWLQAINDSNNCSSTITYPARTDKPGKRWWQSVLTWTSAQAAVATWQFRPLAATAIPASVTAGAIVDCEMEINLLSVTSIGALEVHFEVQDSGGTTLVEGLYQYNQSVTTPEPSFSGVIGVRGIVIPASAAKVSMRAVVRNLAATNGGLTLQLGDIVMRPRITV